MKNSRKNLLVPISLTLGLCLFSILFVVFEKDIYTWRVNQSIPEPSIFQVDISRRTIIQIYPNPDGIEWLGTRWTEDGQFVEVYDSRGQVYANTLMVIDPENFESSNDTELLEGENILGITNELPFTLEDQESLWAGCGNFFFTGKNMENNLWETRLWKGDQLVKTFQSIDFHFDLYQSGFNDNPVGWTIEYSNFSPDCRYSVMSFGRDVWLLDTVEKSFLPIFTAQHFRYSLRDIVEGYHQLVLPSWAPNSEEFVFGDTTFGLEKYNIQTEKRSWLLAPGLAGGEIKWSKTGTWILAPSGSGVVIISATGARMGILEEACKSMENIAWSSNDRIAFICKDYEKADYLVIWDLANLDGN